MIIKNIQIQNLHGEYNYNVDFNDKLTFLYGSNGCGKTTILNILASIVTGKIYNLVDYIFSEIVLTYVDRKNHSKMIQIVIDVLDENTKNMKINYDNEVFIINNIDGLIERLSRKSEDENLDKCFYSMYPFSKRIKDAFNYVYLPLSRYGNDNLDTEMDYYRYIVRRQRFVHQPTHYNTYLNDSLRYIEGLIRNNCMEISYKENKINEQFRNDVLSSSISVSSEFPISSILSQIENLKWDDVLKSKEIYVKTLEDINIYEGEFKDKIDNYFKEFNKAYDDYQRKKNVKEKMGIRIDFAWQYAEFLKIESIVKLAKKNEEIKEKVRKPKEVFLEVINEFFYSAGSGKKILIGNDGLVFFEEHQRRLRLMDLSSGEKQIIITFASLIFGLDDKKRGVFIVDEPEASLHLEWQSKFVSRILKIDKNVQLIFATHSPELIGKYRNYSVKLVKKLG